MTDLVECPCVRIRTGVHTPAQFVGQGRNGCLLCGGSGQAHVELAASFRLGGWEAVHDLVGMIPVKDIWFDKEHGVPHHRVRYARKRAIKIWYDKIVRG